MKRVLVLSIVVCFLSLNAFAQKPVLSSKEKKADATTQASPGYKEKEPPPVAQKDNRTETLFKMLTITEGMSEEEVRKIMGSIDESSQTWEFLQGAITFEDGKVKSTTVLQESIRDLLEQIETENNQEITQD